MSSLRDQLKDLNAGVDRMERSPLADPAILLMQAGRVIRLLLKLSGTLVSEVEQLRDRLNARD
jgi:hypothetical protein